MKKADKAPTEMPSCAPTGKSPDFLGFVAKLLAPLPEDEETADSNRFKRLVEIDRMHPWRDAMEVVEMTKVRIPTMPPTHSDLIAPTVPI